MAARPSVVAVKSAAFTPDGGEVVNILGNAQAVITPREVWREQSVRDGNTGVSTDDAEVEVVKDVTLMSDDVDNFILGLTDNDWGGLVIKGSLIGDDTNTVLQWTFTKMQVEPEQSLTMPGQKGQRLPFGRVFRALEGSAETKEKAAS